MECPYAYLKSDIEYVLCKKEPEPNRHDRNALFHAACGHQAECPKAHCHKLTASWIKCVKLAGKPLNAVQATFATNATNDEGPEKKPSRSRKKPQE